MVVTVTHDQLLTACACRSFAASVATAGPYSSLDALLSHARDVWYTQTSVAGWLEAFAAHPRIGDLDSLRAKYGAFADLSKGEQAAAAASATDDVLKELQTWNARYEAKFGHIFIICARGKRADEMLEAVRVRYNNAPLSELAIAAGQQMAITELRLRDMLASGNTTGASLQRRAGQLLAQLRPGPQHTATSQPRTRSPITTHVLDTAMGRPAQGVPVQLFYLQGGSEWVLIGAGATNRDGRIGDLLPASHELQPGSYRICFDTTAYMATCKAMHPTFFADVPFYPRAEIHFAVAPGQVGEHFHVPLTWNPYGYSTYRGS